MENWKVALVSGAAGVGTAMFLKKKWTAGIILAGVGLAALASEYPEKFAEVRRRLPDFIERGNNFLEVATRVGDRLAEAAENRSQTWYESLAYSLTPADGGPTYSMPRVLRASGLSRSGVHGGVQTTLTVALRTPGICSTRALTCSPIMNVRRTALGRERHFHGHVLFLFRRGVEADPVNQSQIDNVDRNFRIVTLLQGA